MPQTINHEITEADGWLRVAEDAQPVSFSFEMGVGQYRIDPKGASIADGRRGHYLGQAPQHAALEAGEALFVLGEGRLILTANAPLISDDA